VPECYISSREADITQPSEPITRTFVTDISYLQAIVIGLLQGITELFPVSSLGHSVLVPALFGGSWQLLVTESATRSSEQSPYLAFIVTLHVATAVALLIFFWRDWVRLIGSLFHTVRSHSIATSDERLAWLIIIATIPVGLTGLLLEHTFRTLFAKPLAAAICLTINGIILLTGERLRRQVETRAVNNSGVASTSAATGGGAATGPGAVATRHRTLDSLGYRETVMIGLFQVLALFAGISRSGITMVAGLLRGLDHHDAAHFSFLLATPVIMAAGVLKLPSLVSPASDHIHGQVVVGALVAGVAAYLSVRFLTRYFTTRTLTPFATYCLIVGALCTLRFALG
jgi:undecaprenyl-diphosphatase